MKKTGAAEEGKSSPADQAVAGPSGPSPGISRAGVAPKRFQTTQYGFSVPKPSYHRYLENEDASEAGHSPQSAANEVSGSHSLRSRRTAFWVILLIIMIAYAAAKFMH